MSKLYNVVWKVGNVTKEVIAYQKPRPLALHIKKEKEKTTHKIGKVVIV